MKKEKMMNNMKPTTEQAEFDLKNIRLELKCMQLISDNAYILSTRNDVNNSYYHLVHIKVNQDCQKGLAVEKKILELYPELK